MTAYTEALKKLEQISEVQKKEKKSKSHLINQIAFRMMDLNTALSNASKAGANLLITVNYDSGPELGYSLTNEKWMLEDDQPTKTN